ncbi:hypothetical protein WMY93_012126 [Mugilogobius chulae]|uniref:Uncharacterized protein n=1 Tax=Mugilogobius chulae TaxID=88201 RepID=A0AAW0P5U1_9GOBI
MWSRATVNYFKLQRTTCGSSPPSRVEEQQLEAVALWLSQAQTDGYAVTTDSSKEPVHHQ